MSGPGFIAAERPGVCSDCGKVAETRPYGANGARICYECGQKDTAGTERRMAAYLFGETTPPKTDPEKRP